MSTWPSQVLVPGTQYGRLHLSSRSRPAFWGAVCQSEYQVPSTHYWEWPSQEDAARETQEEPPRDASTSTTDATQCISPHCTSFADEPFGDPSPLTTDHPAVPVPY